MPSSARQRWRIGASASIAIPSSTRTSALPELPDAERLPCLATGTPQAATTIAVAVDTLTVAAPSPPVPQVSRSPAGGVSRPQGAIRARTASTAPASSSAVSPLSCKAVRNAAIAASDASPSMITLTAAAVSAAVRSRPPASRRTASSSGVLTGFGPTGVRSPP